MINKQINMASSDFQSVKKTFPVSNCNPTDCLLDWTSEADTSTSLCLQTNDGFSQSCTFKLEDVVKPFQLDFYKAKFGQDREYNLLLHNYCLNVGLHQDCANFTMSEFCASYPNHPDCSRSVTGQSSSAVILFLILLFFVFLASRRVKKKT